MDDISDRWNVITRNTFDIRSNWSVTLLVVRKNGETTDTRVTDL